LQVGRAKVANASTFLIPPAEEKAPEPEGNYHVIRQPEAKCCFAPEIQRPIEQGSLPNHHYILLLYLQYKQRVII
jgi:hypothetical protein